jgi:hypothetical protein
MNKLTNSHKILLQSRLDNIQSCINAIGTNKHDFDIICGMGASIRSLDFNLEKIEKELRQI